MTDLKPCPFCGGEAELAGVNAPEFWVWCPSCKASTAAHTGKQSAIEAWNTRAERTCVLEGEEYDDLLEEFSFDLSCGHTYWSNLSTCPTYCPYCGAKVVE